MNDERYCTADDEPRLPTHFRQMLWDLCELLSHTNGLNNGVGALYWNLIAVCQRHAERNCEPEDNK